MYARPSIEQARPFLETVARHLDRHGAADPFPEIEMRIRRVRTQQPGSTTQIDMAEQSPAWSAEDLQQSLHKLGHVWPESGTIQPLPAETYSHTFSTPHLPHYGASATPLRTTTTYDHASMTQTTSTCQKKVLAQAVFSAPLSLSSSSSSISRVEYSPAFEIKFAMSQELPVPETHLEHIQVVPTWVRCCTRSSFLYTPRDRNYPVFRYDLSQVWEAPSWKQVEHLMDQDAPARVEIELEMIEPLELSRRHNLVLAWDMMLKMMDLLPPHDTAQQTKG